MAKFGRPDGIEEHHVVAVAAGSACGNDFVMQRFVGDELKVDFDIRVLFSKSAVMARMSFRCTPPGS